MATICQTARTARARRVAIFGVIGTQNLGDDATVAAVIQNIRRRHPDVDLLAFVRYPGDTRQRHRIPAFPQRWDLKDFPPLESNRPKDQSLDGEEGGLAGLYSRAKAGLRRIPWLYSSLRAARSCLKLFLGMLRELSFVIRMVPRLAGSDLLIVTGSGQLMDHFEGPWSYPYTCLKWVLMARLVKAKVVFMSVGASPLCSSLSKLFFRCALPLASYRSFRDDTSRSLAEKIAPASMTTSIPTWSSVFVSPILPPRSGSPAGGQWESTRSLTSTECSGPKVTLKFTAAMCRPWLPSRSGSSMRTMMSSFSQRSSGSIAQSGTSSRSCRGWEEAIICTG